MTLNALVGHNGVVWLTVPQGDLSELLDVLSWGPETIEMDTQSDPDNVRVLTALLVEPGKDDGLRFQVVGGSCCSRVSHQSSAGWLSPCWNSRPTPPGIRLAGAGFDWMAPRDYQATPHLVVFELAQRPAPATSSIRPFRST